MRLISYRPGQLARNTLWVTLGQGLRTLIQAGYFILIARSLGAQGYGAFAGVVALIGIMAPFAGWGGGGLLIKNVARNPQRFNLYWGRLLLFISVSGTLLVGLAYVLSNFLLPSIIPVSVVLAVAVSDLLFEPVNGASKQAFQAFQRLRWTAAIAVLLACSRLVAAAVLVLTVPQPTPQDWAWLYLGGTVFTACISFWLVKRELGSPVWSWANLLPEISEGFYFSTSLSAQRVYGEIDKTLLTRLATLQAAGIYSTAYRLLETLLIPPLALAQAAYARFFQHGGQGVESSAGYAKRLLPVALGYAILASAGIYLLAPLLPLILGQSYQQAAIVAHWLAVLPILMIWRRFIANALTGAGLQRGRSAVEVGAAVLNLVANLILIPAFSWRGAVIATILTELMLLLGLWLIVKRGRLHAILQE